MSVLLFHLVAAWLEQIKVKGSVEGDDDGIGERQYTLKHWETLQSRILFDPMFTQEYFYHRDPFVNSISLPVH